MCTLAAPSLGDLNLEPRVGEAVIDDAIATAQDGEIIFLKPGLYIERIVATARQDCKTLRIVGMSDKPADVVIRSKKFRHAIGNESCQAMGGQLDYTFENITFASAADARRFKDGFSISNCTVRFVNCRFVGIQGYYDDSPSQPSGADSNGALHLHQCDASFSQCEFTDNGVTWARVENSNNDAVGGAVYAFDCNTAFADCTFNRNYARSCDQPLESMADPSSALGGAIAAKRGSLRVERCRFDSNLVSGNHQQPQPDHLRGGAIHARWMDQVRLYDNEFISNRASQVGHDPADNVGRGGGVYITDSERWSVSYLSGNTFIENMAGDDGGAVYGASQSLVKANGDHYECNSIDQVAGTWSDRGRNTFIHCNPLCPGDFNRDGSLDKRDLYQIFDNWGPDKDGSKARLDLNGDGVINYDDVIEWLLMGDCNKGGGK
jgi:hypothetical protein